MMANFELSSAAEKARLNIMVEKGPPYLRPLFRAVRDHRLGLMMVPQGLEPFEVPTGRPAVVIIGDDLQEALGPYAFHRKSLKRLIWQSSGGVIVASGPTVEAYAMVAVTAIGMDALGGPRRCTFLIETLPHREGEWLEFIHRIRPGVTVPTWTVAPEERSKPPTPMDAAEYAHIFDEVTEGGHIHGEVDE